MLASQIERNPRHRPPDLDPARPVVRLARHRRPALRDVARARRAAEARLRQDRALCGRPHHRRRDLPRHLADHRRRPPGASSPSPPAKSGCSSSSAGRCCWSSPWPSSPRSTAGVPTAIRESSATSGPVRSSPRSSGFSRAPCSRSTSRTSATSKQASARSAPRSSSSSGCTTRPRSSSSAPPSMPSSSARMNPRRSPSARSPSEPSATPASTNPLRSRCCPRVNLHVSTPRKIKRAVRQNRQWFGALLGFTVAATAALVAQALERRSDDEPA